MESGRNVTAAKQSALSSYRVVDLTEDRGIYCARLLADMGAEVIRIEKPESSHKEAVLETDNLGKRSVTLNLHTEQGREIFKRLVDTVDVVVEGFRPGYLASLGLDYSQLSQAYPRLVMASITDFGQNGAYRDYQSSDLVALALGGHVSICGDPDKPPLKPYGRQAEYTASLYAATGILVALQERHRSGVGQYIDISVMECLAATLDHVLVRYFYEGTVAKRQGSLYWNDAFRVFLCRDGYVLLSLMQQWQTLVEWLDDEGMAEDLTDEKWLDREKRRQEIDHIVEVLERWTKTHTVAELVEQGQLMRFPWAAVSTIQDVIENPQLAARSFFIALTDPVSDKQFKYPGVPAKLSASPWQVGDCVPAPGDDNHDIYHGELVFTQEDIDNLKRAGII